MKQIFIQLIFIIISSNLYSQISIAENTQITLKNETNLNISGNFKNNGAIYGSGVLNLVDSKSQSISGNGIIENFRVDKNGGQAEITEGNQDVFRGFEIHGGNFSPNARLTLKSNDTLTAQIGINTGGIINGDVIIERFIPKSNRAYRYFSSPVSTSESILQNLQEGQNNSGTNYPEDNIDTISGFGTHITGSTTGQDGFDATLTGNPSFFSWNADPQSWSSLNNTELRTLAKGESFSLLIRGSRATSLNSNTAIGPETTLRLTGNPSILNFSKNIPLEIANSYILLGNPYHAAIDANLFLGRNAGLNTNFIYVFDPSLNSRGGYATVELPSGTNEQGSEANQFLQPWQAVFIEATNASPTTLNLSFTEGDKKVSEPQVEIFSTLSRIDLKLQSDNKTIDAVSLKLKDGANSEVDERDAKKFWNRDENISIYSHNTYLSIEEKAFSKNHDTIMIHTYQKLKESYKLLIESSNLSETKVILKDFYLDKDYLLEPSQDLLIDYEVADSEPELRFGLIIGDETLSNEEFTSDHFQVYPNPATDVLNIETVSGSYQKLNFKIYSLLGQKVAEGNFENQERISNYDISTFSAGVYLLVITNDNNLKETLKFIKI
jgi:hypothetical protein